jgi:hypothetical protein
MQLAESSGCQQTLQEAIGYQHELDHCMPIVIEAVYLNLSRGCMSMMKLCKADVDIVIRWQRAE